MICATVKIIVPVFPVARAQSLALFTIVFGGASAAPAAHKANRVHKSLAERSLELVDKTSYTSQCYDAWVPFDKARCWCHTGCALDCSIGKAGTAGDSLHPDWCTDDKKASLAECESLTNSIITACDDEPAENKPGLGSLCSTAGYTGDACVKTPSSPPPAPEQLYCAGSSTHIYSQDIESMSLETAWQLIGFSTSDLACKDVAVSGSTIYCTGYAGQIYKQELATMTSTSDWVITSKGSCQRATVYGQVIYCVGTDGLIYTQNVDKMTVETDWSKLTTSGTCQGVAVTGSDVYCTGSDGQIYKWLIEQDPPEDLSRFELTGKANCVDIATDGDTIFCAGADGQIYKQALGPMTTSTDWTITGGMLPNKHYCVGIGLADA
jgi:hypothetical protein